MPEKETKYLSVSDEDLQIGAAILQEGGTVIFPTETVYGLGADARSPKAAEKIFEAKGRPSDNPLIVHIAEEEQLNDLVIEIPEKAKTLMQAFWPGPLTLIFKKAECVPTTVTGGLSTVAVRMPEHPVAKKLLSIAKVPVAAPSANLSGKPSPTTFLHVKQDMDGRVDAIVDGGNCRVGVESTVLDISGEIPVLYRPGGVTKEQIESLIGPIQVVTKAKEGESPKSPGLKYKHYAPDAEIQILRGSMEQVEAYAKQLSKEHKTAILTFDEFPAFPDHIITYSLGSRNNPEDAAHRLFAALRNLDLQGVTYILAPEIPDDGVWSAVRNRLYRAAGVNIISLAEKSVLFVCTGNTCRSPMAEGILKEIAKRERLSVSVSSAGICAGNGSASQNAIQAMQEIGITISEHHPTQLTFDKIQDADLVLTMTTGHKQMILQAFGQCENKVFTLSEWAGESTDILDPYGGDLAVYCACRDEIQELLEKGWRKLK